MALIRTSPRTQPKNKGLSQEKSSSVEETHKQLNHKASWDSESIRIFLQLIADEITKRNRSFLVLSQAGYKSLARKFEKKNRKTTWPEIVEEWKKSGMRKLMDSSRGVSGIAFDSEIDMFQASDEWWNKMGSINKVCAKFMKKTLEHRELMEAVFTGASATSKHHWTLGEKVTEAVDVSSNSANSLGAQLFADPIPARAEDVDSDSSIEPVPTGNDKRKQTLSTSYGKLKKATSGASVIAENMNNLTNMVRT